MIVVNFSNQFWTGKDWSNEYPNAKVYSSINELIEEYCFKHIDEKLTYSGFCCVENYGMENETVIYENKPVEKPLMKIVHYICDSDRCENYNRVAVCFECRVCGYRYGCGNTVKTLTENFNPEQIHSCERKG